MYPLVDVEPGRAFHVLSGQAMCLSSGMTTSSRVTLAVVLFCDVGLKLLAEAGVPRLHATLNKEDL